MLYICDLCMLYSGESIDGGGGGYNAWTIQLVNGMN